MLSLCDLFTINFIELEVLMLHRII